MWWDKEVRIGEAMIDKIWGMVGKKGKGENSS